LLKINIDMWNLKDFESVYERYRSSGLCVKYFCQNEGIAENKFYYWRNKQKSLERAFNQPTGFVPIVFNNNSTELRNTDRKPVMGNHSSCGNMFEIVYPNGVVVRIPQETDIKQVQLLILLNR